MSVVRAAEILGVEVPSTAPVFLAILAVHVTAGFTCAVTGAVAALSRKGRGRHVRWGRLYYWSLAVVFATATALAAMRFSHDWHLLVIGAVAFAAGTAGLLARRRHVRGDGTHIIGMGVSYVGLLTAFYVDNGGQLPLWDRLPTLAYWLLPAAVGAPLIWCAAARRRTTAPREPAHTA